MRAWTTSKAGASASTYAVVFDAGSTGSRVHIFEFTTEGTELVLAKDTFEHLQPGLGDAGWASDPQRAAESLQPLISKALATVPPAKHAETPIELRATAGLRLLEGSQAEDILTAVRKLLRAAPFRLAGDGVSIMDGADEGAFAWLTLNYLLGLTGAPPEELVGALDLGGVSVQAAFAVDAETAKRAPDGAPLHTCIPRGVQASERAGRARTRVQGTCDRWARRGAHTMCTCTPTSTTAS